jgi:hypothetical protein
MALRLAKLPQDVSLRLRPQFTAWQAPRDLGKDIPVNVSIRSSSGDPRRFVFRICTETHAKLMPRMPS